MKGKLLGLILVLLLLFGCTVEGGDSSANDSNKLNVDSNLSVAKPSQNGAIFCELPKLFKMSYDEKYYTKDGVEGVVMKRYINQTNDTHYYYERLDTLPQGVGTWTIASDTSFMVYSNTEGECTAVKHNALADYNPFTQPQPIYYETQFTGETKQIGGSAIGYKLKQTENLGDSVGSEMVTLADYINKEYCIPLTQDINSDEYVSHSEKINLTREFSDNIFELPLECKNATVTDMQEYSLD